MGDAVKFKIDGLRELEQAVKELRDEMTKRGETDQNIVKLSLGAVARKVKGRQQERAPVDTGRLRNSIFVKYERNPRHLSEVVYVGPRAGKSRDDPKGAWYAAIVEMLGGRGGRGKGFMRNSIRHESDARMYGHELGKRIESRAKKIGNKAIQAVGSRAKKRFK